MSLLKTLSAAGLGLLPLLMAADAPTTRPTVVKSVDPKHLKLAIVTNNTSDYWRYARAGVVKYGKEVDVEIDFKMPGNGKPSEQVEMVQNLVDAGCDGIAVSTIDPKEEAAELKKLVDRKTNLVCFDAPCPDAGPVLSIYTDNTAAGRAVGKHLVELFPDGGKVAVVCGSFQSASGGDRLAGIKQAVKDHKIDLIEIEDHADEATTVSATTDALNGDAGIKAVVGLWSYEGGGIVNAVREAGKTGTVTVIAFDQEEAVLKGVADGKIESAFVSDPFQMGYKTAKWLHDLAVDGDAAKLPADGKVPLEMRRIDKSNIDAYRQELDEQKKSVD